MTDLFSRLARRTLRTRPRLSVRLPARFEPARVPDDARADMLQAAPAANAGPAPGSRPPRSRQEAPAPEGLLPPSASSAPQDAEAAAPGRPADTEPASLPGEIGPDRATRPAPAPQIMPAEEQPRQAPQTRRHAAPAPSRGQLREFPASHGNERSLHKAAAASRSTEGSREAQAAVAAPIAEAGPWQPRRGTAPDELEQRLNPLLPPQAPKEPRGAPANVPSSGPGGPGGESAAPPTVEVTIGTIEVRAALPAAPPAPAPTGPTLTLDDYLKRRHRGEG